MRHDSLKVFVVSYKDNGVVKFCKESQNAKLAHSIAKELALRGFPSVVHSKTIPDPLSWITDNRFKIVSAKAS